MSLNDIDPIAAITAEIEKAEADMLILGTLAAISACLPNIYAIYARRELFTVLYLFVTARAGSGKGRLTLCRAIVDPIHEELRAESNRLEEQFRVEKEQYKRQKKGDGIPNPRHRHDYQHRPPAAHAPRYWPVAEDPHNAKCRGAVHGADSPAVVLGRSAG